MIDAARIASSADLNFLRSIRFVFAREGKLYLSRRIEFSLDAIYRFVEPPPPSPPAVETNTPGRRVARRSFESDVRENRRADFTRTNLVTLAAPRSFAARVRAFAVFTPLARNFVRVLTSPRALQPLFRARALPRLAELSSSEYRRVFARSPRSRVSFDRQFSSLRFLLSSARKQASVFLSNVFLIAKLSFANNKATAGR